MISLARHFPLSHAFTDVTHSLQYIDEPHVFMQDISAMVTAGSLRRDYLPMRLSSVSMPLAVFFVSSVLRCRYYRLHFSFIRIPPLQPYFSARST